MEKSTKDAFQSFAEKAMKRLEEKRKTKYETLHIRSIDENIRIRELNAAEIAECTVVEDENDPNKADKYCIYLSVVEPDLKKTAMELKDKGLIHEYPEVTEIFEMSEITEIATEIMKLSGVIGSRKVTVVDELKN